MTQTSHEKPSLCLNSTQAFIFTKASLTIWELLGLPLKARTSNFCCLTTLIFLIRGKKCHVLSAAYISNSKHNVVLASKFTSRYGLCQRFCAHPLSWSLKSVDVDATILISCPLIHKVFTIIALSHLTSEYGGQCQNPDTIMLGLRLQYSQRTRKRRICICP